MSEYGEREFVCQVYDLDEPAAYFTSGRCQEVVRCRDCEHCMSYWKSDYCDYFSHVTNDPDGFCAWGKRREDA